MTKKKNEIMNCILNKMLHPKNFKQLEKLESEFWKCPAFVII